MNIEKIAEIEALVAGTSAAALSNWEAKHIGFETLSDLKDNYKAAASKLAALDWFAGLIVVGTCIIAVFGSLLLGYVVFGDKEHPSVSPMVCCVVLACILGYVALKQNEKNKSKYWETILHYQNTLAVFEASVNKLRLTESGLDLSKLNSRTATDRMNSLAKDVLETSRSFAAARFTRDRSSRRLDLEAVMAAGEAYRNALILFDQVLAHLESDFGIDIIGDACFESAKSWVRATYTHEPIDPVAEMAGTAR